MLRKIGLCLAGNVESAGERVHILHLERALKLLGFEVVVPFREKAKLRELASRTPDIPGNFRNCHSVGGNPGCSPVESSDENESENIVCIEDGHAIPAKGRTIVYRTASNRSVEMTAMPGEVGKEFAYHPCLLLEFDDIDGYYSALACEIHEAVVWILEKEDNSTLFTE